MNRDELTESHSHLHLNQVVGRDTDTPVPSPIHLHYIPTMIPVCDLDVKLHPVHVLEKETVYMKKNMEIKITEIKNDSTHK